MVTPIPSMGPSATYFSRFRNTLDAGGGARRAAQIMDVLGSIGCEFHSVAENAVLQKRLSCQSNVSFVGKIRERVFSDRTSALWGEHRRTKVARLADLSGAWLAEESRFRDLGVAILDDPIYFQAFMKMLTACKVPIVAICHNLETLDANRNCRSGQRRLLERELDVLSRCNLVVTISREETLLLTNFNIQCVFFPYFPVTAIYERLVKVRNKRSNQALRHTLLLGTAANILTREGMAKMIQHWRENGLSKVGGTLLVAGYKSECFFPIDESSHEVRFLGTLDNHELDKHLSSIKACLCYQERGAGALTRIPEMLIAGVPVVANSHAARSYYNAPGVSEFCDLDDLEGVLAGLGETQADIPMPSPPRPSILLTPLKRLLSR